MSLFFLSLTFFFRLIPEKESMEAPCVHLSAWVFKTWTGRRSASSLPRETRRAPVASVNRANSLSRSFIGFLCKQRNIGLFLSSIFLSTTFFPYLCLNLYISLAMPSPLGITLDPPGLVPGTWSPLLLVPLPLSELGNFTFEARVVLGTWGASINSACQQHWFHVGSFVAYCLVTKSCPTLCNPMD